MDSCLNSSGTETPHYVTPIHTSSAIIAPEDWTNELSLREVFDFEGPFEVDIGCGKGRFLAARAEAHPDRLFLGIDRLKRRLRRADKKIVRAGLANVRLLRIEASYAVRFLLPAQSVSAFYILFPDPWPKKRHHRRRLFNQDFLNAAHRTLAQAGTIHVATDHQQYFEQIQEILNADSRFLEVDAMVLSEKERTNFEIQFTKKGIQILRCSFTKRA